MAQKSKFKRLSLSEFADWLSGNRFDRQIGRIQNHHTYIPGYAHFKGDNHVALCENMERYHLERGFAEIAQNLTIFPDGGVVLCRNFNTIPAGIKGANRDSLCIENLGNFDAGGDIMSEAQREAIVKVNALLLTRFGLPCDSDHVVYHHWWDLNTGQRTDGTGTTKTCPGNAFFGGNTVAAAENHFLPLIAAAMGVAVTPNAAPVPLFRGEVHAEGLRVRDRPSQSGQIITTVSNGAEVAVFEESNNWYRIHPSVKRWVNGRYVHR